MPPLRPMWSSELSGRSSSDLDDLERESLFFGEYDDSAAILSVHAGAGGVDAADWAEMMLRMYLRYFERRGFKVEVDEVLEAEEAGIRSATVTVRGEHAYGILLSRSEASIVWSRISPFDAQSRRHTSFAGVDVIPEVEETEVEIDEEDLRIDTFRSSGAGRPARQRHRLGGPDHPSADQHRRGLSGGALPTPEQEQGDGPAGVAIGRPQPQAAQGGNG